MNIYRKWIAIAFTTVLLLEGTLLCLPAVPAHGAEAVQNENCIITKGHDSIHGDGIQEEDLQEEGLPVFAVQTDEGPDAAREGNPEDQVIDPEDDLTEDPRKDAEDLSAENTSSSAEVSYSEDPEASAEELLSEDPETSAEELLSEDPETSAEELLSEDPEASAEELLSEDPEASAEDGSSEGLENNVNEDNQEEGNAPEKEGLTIEGQPESHFTEEELSEEEGPEFNETTFPDGVLLVTDETEEYFDPGEDDVPAYGNDDAFAAYVNRELGLTGDLQADTGDFTPPSLKKRGNYASNSLVGANRTLYGILLEQIREIAAGNRASTSFSVTLNDLGVESMSWTAEELGEETVLNEEGKIKNTVKSLIYQDIEDVWGINISLLNKALLSDCPYDLYWYNKTGTKTINGQVIRGGLSYSLGLSYYTDGSKLFFAGPVKISFYVAPAYAGSETFTVDTQIGTSVTAARENALQIVEENEGKSDYEKLDSYRESILRLTDYNSDASNNSNVPYGDPWQLIHVFDKDPETNVVCEGYSKAFQYLCDLSSFSDIFKECISVTGDINGSGHMWNIVMLQDGRNYLADITNCDNIKNDGVTPASMIGSGNEGRNLFLVGIRGETVTDQQLADGSAEEGYTFHLSRNVLYEYDSDMFKAFSAADLTLAEGRVTAETTASGDHALTHTHIYLPSEAVEATCTTTGLTAGSHCAICGDSTQEVIPVLPHVPGAWTMQLEPTYEEEGLETTQCTVCGGEMTRTVAKLIAATGVEFAFEEPVTVYLNKNLVLEYSLLPSETTDTYRDLLWESSDSDVAAVDNGVVTGIDPGEARITAVHKNGYPLGTCTVIVRPVDLAQAVQDGNASAVFTDPDTEYTYDGEAKEPSVTVTCGNETLVDGKDYTVTWSDSRNQDKAVYAGEAAAAITGIGCYEGTVSLPFTIGKASQTLTVKASSAALIPGKTATVSVTGAMGRKTFTSSNTAAVEIDQSTGRITAKKVGTAKITVTSAATTNYEKAAKSITVKVLPAATTKVTASNLATGIKISWAEVEGADGYFLYRNGTKIKTITGGSTLKYIDPNANTNGTKYTFKVVATASAGTSSLSRSAVTYRVARPAFTALQNSASGKVTLSWGKNAKASGYQILYSTDKEFGSYKSVSVSSASSVTRSIIGLTKGKTWYFRIRTRKIVDDKSFWSAWSLVKGVKVSR